MTYTPDNWVVLKLTGKGQTVYKVLAGWSGGYLDGDSWRMNSGITSVTKSGDYYFFKGSSGSVYECHKDSYTLRGNNFYIYDQLMGTEGLEVEMLPEDTDWENFDYGPFIEPLKWMEIPSD